jgi:hypothetical protein
MKAWDRWEIIGPVIAWMTWGRTQTGPGLKKRTCPAEPVVESKLVLMT